jgi:hypothetical protein
VKVGIVIQHYDARNDVRELIDYLENSDEVVLFGSCQALREISTPSEKRAFRQHIRIRDLFWLQAWNLFGELPASRNNFLITELFKLAGLSPVRRRIAGLRLKLRLMLPSLISFDFLLDRLGGSDTTLVEDIDRFLVITEVSSSPFLSGVLRAGIPVDAYVYSWDHACKHATFSKRIDRWLVWHEGIAQDLVELQRVPSDRIRVVGATQLAYVHEYLSRPELRERRIDAAYMYYGCGVGIIEMAGQEARLIEMLAETLQRVAPDVRLLVRPYPMLADTDFFRALRDRPNVRFDEDYREGRSDRSLTRDSIFERLNHQEHALAFLHCGTTMGLEGAYLRPPVLFLDLQDVDYGLPRSHPLHLSRFTSQYHNQRYMTGEASPNVIRDLTSLENCLAGICAGSEDYSAYNHRLARLMPLRSLSEVASGISRVER